MGCGPSEEFPPPDTCPENNNKHQNGFVARDDVKQQPDHVSGGEVTEGVRTRKVREDIRIREVTEQVQVKEEQDPVQKPQRQRASASTERSGVCLGYNRVKITHVEGRGSARKKKNISVSLCVPENCRNSFVRFVHLYVFQAKYLPDP